MHGQRPGNTVEPCRDWCHSDAAAAGNAERSTNYSGILSQYGKKAEEMYGLRRPRGSTPSCMKRACLESRLQIEMYTVRDGNEAVKIAEKVCEKTIGKTPILGHIGWAIRPSGKVEWCSQDPKACNYKFGGKRGNKSTFVSTAATGIAQKRYGNRYFETIQTTSAQQAGRASVNSPASF